MIFRINTDLRTHFLRWAFSTFGLISEDLILGQDRPTIDVSIPIFELWQSELSVMSAWFTTVPHWIGDDDL